MKLKSTIAIALCLTLVACTVSQVVSTLETITTDAEGALTAASPQLAVFADAAAGAADCAANIIQSSDTVLVKSADILACFASVVAPAIPGVEKIVADINTFLAAYQTPAAQAAMKAGVPVKLTWKDKRNIASIHKTAHSVHAKALLIEQPPINKGKP